MCHEHLSLCEALDRILSRGVVLRGDVVISVADVDLIYIGLWALVCSVDQALEMGVDLPQPRIPQKGSAVGDRV